jgi:hypothetical protein
VSVRLLAAHAFIAECGGSSARAEGSLRGEKKKRKKKSDGYSSQEQTVHNYA